MITIDGARGEGGGQILRTSLALSLITGRPVRFLNIRAGRRKPGLLRQHLTGLRAAAAIGAAHITGDQLGSGEATFAPTRSPAGGGYHFKVGSAGSAGLVLQTVLPALLRADGPSEVVIEGGTHNMSSPPHDFLERCYLPLLAELGGEVSLTLERPGFYPAGGGRYRVRVTPSTLKPIEVLERGALLELRARAVVSQIPAGVGRRELKALQERLSIDTEALEFRRETRSPGPGNVVTVDVKSERLTAVFTGFGKRGVTAEAVARGLSKEVRAYLAAGVPVGPHLADQLLLLLALAGGGAFVAQRPTLHTTTNVDTIGRFLDVPIAVRERDRQRFELRVG